MDSNKYDRQVRFWSESGQEALRSCHVLVVGASIASLEAAKGLILAGVGSLTLVAGTTHAPNAGLSLFSANVHELREQLQSLNSDSNVSAVTGLAEVHSVTLVIHDCASEHSVSDITSRFMAPVLSIGSCMLQGYVRLTASDLFVLEPHPEAGLADLRVSETSLQQWPEFREFCESFDLPQLNDAEHAHVPYYVLLAKAYRKGMTLAELRQALQAMSRSPHEENFAEAAKYAPLAIRADTDIPQGALELLKFREQHRLHDTSPVWQLIAALGEFIKRHGILPVSGEVPDMISSTESFVKLKRIYAARFQDDVNEMATYLPDGAGHADAKRLLHRFCRNSRVVKYVYRNTDHLPQPLPMAESCRSHGGREIYAVASLIGGVAVQEATKIIMRQYLPILGVVLYDAASGELAIQNTNEYTMIDAERLS